MPPRLVLRSAVPAVRFVLVGSAVQALLQAGVFSGVYVVTGVCGDGGPYRKAAEEICCCDGARSGWRFWCECGCRCADGVGAADRLPVRGAGSWGCAVRVLRARVDRGLAGSGDVAGTAARSGTRAGGRARDDRGGVLRQRAEPYPAVGAAPAGRSAGRCTGRSGPGWDAVVIGEYERAFYGSQYASTAPLFEHFGVTLWAPEVGGRIDWHAENHEQTMFALGLSSKREITRTRIRVRTAMAAQTREQGRYLGGRPPYGYRLGDAGPHPNKAHAAWGRRAPRLEPDPATAPVVRWMFAQRLAGHSTARITRALNDAGIPCPSAADPKRNPHRAGTAWTLRTVAAILANPRYTGRQVWNRQRTDFDLIDLANTGLGHKQVQRWNLPEGWVISKHPAHAALVSEADFIAAQDATAPRGPAGPAARRYLLAGLLA